MSVIRQKIKNRLTIACDDVDFTTGAIFTPFRAATYEAMVMRGGDANTANVIFFNISGSNSSTYPTVQYMRLLSGTWGAPTTIAV